MTETTVTRSRKKSSAAALGNGKSSRLKTGSFEDSAEARSLQLLEAVRALRDGDRIGLGSRCRITFRRPSAASGTALLDISGARLPTAGIRQVILMDREIVVGPGTAVHIRADQLPAPAVLIRTDDGAGFRSTADVEIDGRTLSKNAVLPLGVSISIGSLRFVISREQRP